VTVTNAGSEPVTVDVVRTGFALDLRGRPRAVLRRLSWLTVAQRQLVLGPGAPATLTVSARVPPWAAPGDHAELVLLTTRPPAGRGLPVRVRLGVVVVVRAPGRIHHRVDIVRARIGGSGRGRRLAVVLANLGNSIEVVGGRCTVVTLHRGRRLVARLHAPSRQLLPRTRGIVDLRFPPGLRGRVAARVVLLRPCGGLRVRTFVLGR
jgi:hypothetical protein